MKKLILVSGFLIILISLPASAQQRNYAKYLSQSTPGEMTAGKDYKISISMKNTGRTTWKSGAYSLKLMDVNESYLKTFGVSSVDVNSTVRPGEDIVFDFSVTAPKEDGEYKLQWQMAEGNAYFGEPTISVPIRVSSTNSSYIREKPINKSVFVDQSIPTQMNEGQVYNLSVTVKNAGNTTWNPNDFKLMVRKELSSGASSDQPWSIPDITLPYDVVPGSQAVFVFRVTAPESSGTYMFQCRMEKDNVQFGDMSKPVNINVN